MAANLREGVRISKIASELKMKSPFTSYPWGPYPVHDAWGMGFAVTQLHRTLDPGKNSSMIQWKTAQKSRAFVSSYIHSTPTGRGMTSMAGNQKTFFSDSPTNALWMDRFYTGCHERMGDVVVQDRALTMAVLKLCCDHWSWLGEVLTIWRRSSRSRRWQWQ
jgi:hypothetical protein